MAEIKVLALDLDGTLTNSQKEVTPHTRAALDAAIAKGVTIVLASGRPTAGVLPLAKELGLDKKGGCILSSVSYTHLACHANDAAASIHDVLEMSNAVQAAVEFQQKHPNETLILVTADHETGGMAIGYKTTNYDTFLTNLDVYKRQKELRNFVTVSDLADYLAAHAGE